jgi:transcription initiation factor TFIIIB Brf1 subunit/transcription initiation factor TFIIB
VAKSKDINKSEEVRKVLQEQPDLKARQIVDLLAEQGVTVQRSQVYAVMRSLGKSPRKGRPGRRRGRPAGSTSAAASASVASVNPVTIITRIKDLASQVGGMKHLRELMEVLAS